MKVRCIDANFSENQGDLLKAIFKVGDDFLLPKEGEEYEVIGYADIDGVEAYEFAEIDTIKHGYDKKLVFGKRRFVVSDDTFVPNAVLKNNLGGSGLCREVNFYLSFDLKTK
ncbi:MAG TPA: hypothetical protein VN026_17920 [Bacteroidia bacterium]|jgi:hypothetical protein|nr:hypothetical protein [Bacteroidia bacterium]